MRNRIFAYAKTKVQISLAVTVKLISTFVLTTLLVQFLLYLYPILEDSSFLMWDLVGNPEDRLSCVVAHMIL